MTHEPQTASENIVGKGEIARNEQFLLFPQCFLLNQIIVSLFFHIFCILSLFAAELEKPKIGISHKGLISAKSLYLTLSKTSPGFKCLLKTTWEKEKLLITSNFSFSHSVFYHFGELSAIFIKLRIVVCKLSVWKNLKFVAWVSVKSISDGKILDWTQLKAFEDHKLTVSLMAKPVYRKEENILEYGKNAGNQHCLLFLQCFCLSKGC